MSLILLIFTIVKIRNIYDMCKDWRGCFARQNKYFLERRHVIFIIFIFILIIQFGAINAIFVDKVINSFC